MDWLTLHKESEAFAREAHEALRNGDTPVAKANFRKAAEVEARALECLDVSKVRTRGITAVSAASLWYKADGFNEACALAYQQLGIGGLPDFAIEQLEDLIQSVYTERERAKYDVSFLPGMVSVSVRGGEVLSEPPRVLWRLQLLREWSHEQEAKQVFPGSPRARSAPRTRAA
ncbi:hypothetical protein [Burkholderia vietnamiensis]|uniref:hypothetical protein n=1 Tax=Burkholderia vietnamiensis TaxID=60552 RepID=UPI001CF50500|nr:hypothetical protein [Burkholderia vietnamiensis]MCA8232437.1 hypothetical protein [Burkholderia vietnamiensis]